MFWAKSKTLQKIVVKAIPFSREVWFNKINPNFLGFGSEESPSIVIYPQNIKRVQKQTQKIIQHREQERNTRGIQKDLDETENLISTVFVIGAELEDDLQWGSFITLSPF